MSFTDWLNPFTKVWETIDKLIPDKDKAAELKSEIDKGAQLIVRQKEKSYQIALQTKTVPWLDALHKMGRQIQGYLGIGLAFYMVHKGINDYAILGALLPSGIYGAIKGKGFLQLKDK